MSTERRSKLVFTPNLLNIWTMLSGQNIAFFRFISGLSWLPSSRRDSWVFQPAASLNYLDYYLSNIAWTCYSHQVIYDGVTTIQLSITKLCSVQIENICLIYRTVRRGCLVLGTSSIEVVFYTLKKNIIDLGFCL